MDGKYDAGPVTFSGFVISDPCSVPVACFKLPVAWFPISQFVAVEEEAIYEFFGSNSHTVNGLPEHRLCHGLLPLLKVRDPK